MKDLEQRVPVEAALGVERDDELLERQVLVGERPECRRCLRVRRVWGHHAEHEREDRRERAEAGRDPPVLPERN